MSSAFSIVFKGLVIIGLITFFSTQLGNLAYGLGLFSAFLGLGFTLPTYVGADCNLAFQLSSIFTSIFIVVICFKVYYMLKSE